uniref:Uncharacterized protein n=1 Tax=Arundo donax TaxID=35708 RepID=A0A0A8ZWM8_ARUDO
MKYSYIRFSCALVQMGTQELNYKKTVTKSCVSRAYLQIYFHLHKKLGKTKQKVKNCQIIDHLI